MHYDIASISVRFGSRPLSRLECLREIQSLKVDLSLIKRDYDAITVDRAADGPMRGAAYNSVFAVNDCMTRIGWNELGFGLIYVLEALTEVEKGRQPSWLSNPSPGRPPPSDRTMLLRAHCAAVMEFLHENGRGWKEAACFVRAKLPPETIEMLTAHDGGHRKITWRSITEWRARVSGAVAPETKPEQERYHATLRALAATPGTIERRAKIMLDGLVKMLG